MPIPNIDLNLA